MTDRVDQLIEDVLDGPAALERLLAAYEGSDTPIAKIRAAVEAAPAVAFTGLGSSRYAAAIAASELRATGRAAWVEHASTGTPTAPAADLVFIAISASGRTAEVIAAARRHRGRSLVVAVTNDPESDLAASADHVLALHAGKEAAGIATRTFRATIAVLAIVVGRTPVSMAPAVGDLATAIESRHRWLSGMADALDGAPDIDVLADASILGLAEQAALMLREGPRLRASADDTGDWLHTAVYLALPGHRALLFPGAAADAEVSQTIERRGGVVVPVPGASAEPDAFRRALVESSIAELVAAELWRRASAEDHS